MATPDVLIRRVRDDDFAAIAALLSHYTLHTPIHFGTGVVNADELRAGHEATRELFAYYVAVDDAGLLGIARASPFRERAGYRFTAEVGVYVAERAQRRGVARALYTRLIDTCRRQGFTNLVAGITLPNDASVGLHEALGFRKVAHFPQIGWKLGDYHDVGFWQLPLSLPPASQGGPPPLRPVDDVDPT